MKQTTHDLYVNKETGMMVLALAFAINCSDGDKDMVIVCPVTNQHLILVFEKSDFFKKHTFYGGRYGNG